MNEREIFVAALKKTDAEQRAAYLNEACGGDAALRQQVEALLREHEQLGSFLEGPAEQRSTIAQPIECTGVVIAGRYKLLEQIGEGGMGTVWMAEQTEPVQRRVAVKLIKPGLDSKQVVARFEAERQALALMDHPNIAKVHDGGLTEAGRPFFAMELVKGTPITKYCDEKKLPVRERLELFADVCRAIQHAHQKGIIHRDLKPSNVLVAPFDGKPLVKVIDFGVAKASGQKLTEATLFTGFGAVVGTPEYMSPEQAELNNQDIDTRSDIYSLGVLLYELLTGTTPLTKRRVKEAALLEVLRVIREEESPRPSTRLSTTEELPSIAAMRGVEPAKLSKLVRGELDWIVMKALEKDRNRRYETANGFAADVQRYLADEPVQACPPSGWYRLKKLFRRNKGPVVAATLVVLALVGGIIGTSAGLVWAVRERDGKARALSAETEAKEAAIKAREAEKQARDQALAALQSVTEEIVENQMARRTHLTEENKELLRNIIKQFEGFAAITATDAESQWIRVQGYARVGRMRYRLGELSAAEAALVKALTIYKRLAAEFPAREEFRRNLALTHAKLGSLFEDTGRLQEAESAYAAALAIQTQLAADIPSRHEIREELAASHDVQGILFQYTGRLKEAEKAHGAGLAIRKQLAAEFPTHPRIRLSLAESNINLGNLLKDIGRSKEAQCAYRDALATLTKLAAEFPNRPEYQVDLATTHNNLANLLGEAGRAKEAESAYVDALSIRKKLAADYPTFPEFRRDLARSHNSLGFLLSRTVRLTDAEAAYVDALAVQKQLAADFPTRPDFRNDLAGTHNNLGNLFRDTGRIKEAETAFVANLALRKQLAADFPTRPDFRQNLARSHNNLASLFATTRRLKEAASAFADAVAIYKQLAADLPSRPAYREELVTSLHNLGHALRDTHRLQEAEAAYADALTIAKRLIAEFPTRPAFRILLAQSYGSLGIVLGDTGRLKEAGAAYAEGLAIKKQLAAEFPNEPNLTNEVAGTLVNLAFLRCQHGDFKGGKAYLEEALPYHQAALKANPRHPRFREYYRNNLSILAKLNAELLDQTGAVRAAEQLRDLSWDPPENAYDAACVLSRCLAIVQNHQRTSKIDREKAVKFYGDQALAMLRVARAKGWNDAGRMKDDKDLDPLRAREDFKTLLAEVESNQKNRK